MGKSFQLLKFSNQLYGILVDSVLTVSNKFQIGNYAIDQLGARPREVCSALASFVSDGKNFAEFGIYGTCMFTEIREVEEYLDLMPGIRKGAA